MFKWRLRTSSVVGLVLFGSLSSAAPVSGGIFDDIFFETLGEAVIAFYDADTGGWGEWEALDGPEDLERPGAEALLIAVPHPEFEDLVATGCVDTGDVEGTAIDFEFGLDVSGCIELPEPGPAVTAADELFPIAVVAWLTFDSDGNPNLPECLSAGARVTTAGQFPAEVEFFDYEMDTTTTAATESIVSGLLDPAVGVAGRGETSRKRYLDPILVPMFFGTSLVSETPPDSIGLGDGVWEVELTFSECSLSDYRGQLDLDRYLQSAESGSLPNTR